MGETAVTGNAFPDFTYEYDKVGNISKLTTLSTAGTDTQTYTYDDLNRLLTASATGGVANYSHTYAYNKLGNMTSGPNGTYTYGSSAHIHAVTAITGGQSFGYDANGNMTSRTDLTGTYTQVFDVENRLTSVTPNGGSATTFAYDANGIRTKTVQPGGISTYFPFPGYEETVNGANTIKRSSYSFAGQTVALRVSGDPVSGNNGLFYVLSDHLGSTSMLVNSSGGAVAGSTTRNLPYGGYRPGSAPTQTITDRDFTGQKENMELGLLYYQARFYVPGIGRFASADTIVPNPANPQSFNRYSYTLNNPIRYTDPTGHSPSDGCEAQGCSSDGKDWGWNFINYIVENTDFYDHTDNPLSQAIVDTFSHTLPLALEDGKSVEDAVMASIEGTINQANSYNAPLSEFLTDRRLFSEGVVAGLAGAIEGRPGAGNGQFSIIDWDGYPDGVPRPSGPFRLIEGEEYDQARIAANSTNRGLHRINSDFDGLEIHEIHPVKFGGSPTDINNKIGLPPGFHRSEVTPWWNRLLNRLLRP